MCKAAANTRLWPNKPSNHIIYEDANGLDGCRMSEFLLHKNRKFDHNVQLDEILSTPDENVTGYALEVDLRFPVVLHDEFKEFRHPWDLNTWYGLADTISKGSRGKHGPTW